MFVILDGECQFTIDGHTSLLKGPAGAPCRMGHSHGMYNPTDKTIQSLNINVAAMKGSYDAFNLEDDNTHAKLDPIPVFMTMRLDRLLLKPVTGMNGGKGTVQYRRALDRTVFLGPWAYVDHLVVPPNTSTGAHLHNEVAEIYFVMKGDGFITVGRQGRGAPPPETAPIRTDDAIPIQLGEVHWVENRGTAPLEFMIVGVSRDSSKRVDSIDVPNVSVGSAGGK
jgi:mannose-6-phosphate isomerase-like protein (cupin superfamily)